jgi:choice-of-anchor C domain-containing protein
MMKILAMAVVLLAICAFGTAHAASSIALDGTLNQGAGSFSDQILGAGSSSIPDWTISGNGVEWVDSYWQKPVLPGGGITYTVNLDGSGPGAMRETLTTKPGQYYQVIFYLSADPDGGTGTKSLTVSSGGSSQNFSYTITGANTDSNMHYLLENSFVFQATGTSTTLSFTSDDPSGSTDGAVVGDVQVDPVPLPAGLLLFAPGLAGLVIGKKRLNR